MKLLKNSTFLLITAAVVLAVLYYLYLQDQPLRENFEDSGGSTFLIVIVVIVVIVGGLMFLGKSSDTSFPRGNSSRSNSVPSYAKSVSSSSFKTPPKTPGRANAAVGNSAPRSDSAARANGYTSLPGSSPRAKGGNSSAKRRASL
jgi:hypothetical protein